MPQRLEESEHCESVREFIQGLVTKQQTSLFEVTRAYLMRLATCFEFVWPPETIRVFSSLYECNDAQFGFFEALER